MKRLLLNIFFAIAILMGLTFSANQPVSAQEGPPPVDRNTPFVPGEIVVLFADSVPQKLYEQKASALASRLGGQVLKRDNSPLALIKVSEKQDISVLAAQVRQSSDVLYAGPNYIYWIPEENPRGKPHQVTQVKHRIGIGLATDGRQPAKTREVIHPISELRAMRSIRQGLAIPSFPNDPKLWDQWGWDYVNAWIIWNNSAPNPAVCVLDTGVDRGHPELAGRVLNGYDFVNMDAQPDDDHGHGTHVAGTIAALMNNNRGFAGISTASIVPVKVLSAQGYGTSFDIAKGIIYCANRSGVKVINMSLGGPWADWLEYYALDYAINTKGKLVVAAAGNSTTSDLQFPAAWAVDWVCINGDSTFPDPCDNEIADGLISVGAARPPWSGDDGILWVDLNGNGTWDTMDDEGEFFPADECATDFSNYGAWVEVVAPGEDILSTTPVSYNFYARYFYGASAQYDWWSGTSMATPHVAGAAARVWSVVPWVPNEEVEFRLKTYGQPLTTAMDPNMSEPSSGYFDEGYKGEAPFCWPDDTHGDEYDMSGSVYLNVADAMDRGAMAVAVSEAITGLPLQGALVTARRGTTLYDSAIVSKDSRWAFLINLPGGVTYTARVSRNGYTDGTVTLGNALIGYGWAFTSPQVIVGIPPMGRINAVLNWWMDDDLDLFTVLPNFYTSDRWLIGSNDFGTLALYPPAGLTWADVGYPYGSPAARWNRDGGWGDWILTESITIRPRPAFPNVPFYNRSASDRYEFWVTDYDGSGLDDTAVVRLWIAGKIFGKVTGDCWDEENNVSLGDWWHAADLVGTTPTWQVFNTCDNTGP